MATLAHIEAEPVTPIPPQSSVLKPKRKLVRRADRDHSQTLRRSFQMVFLMWNVYLGAVFYAWVRQYELGFAPTIARPAGVEGWLPIAGLMNLKYWLITGRVPDIHPAAMYLVMTFLSISLLFRKAFCSWLCPVGTISEHLWRAGRKLFKRNFALPRWLDVPLRGLKYLLLGFFLWAVASMSAEAIAGFMRSPYGLIADVKMLNFFRHMGETGSIVLVTLAIASVFVKNFWCRYLCPYGALLGLGALLSPTGIRRNEPACIDCGKCAKACPSSLPVDRLMTIKSAECTACLECVSVCPAKDALRFDTVIVPNAMRSREVPAWSVAAGIAVLLLGTVGIAKTLGHWQSPIPPTVYRALVPSAEDATHPMPENLR